MNDDLRFRINTPEVVSESFGGEVVAIHFGSGNYYSLTGSAQEVLALLDDGSAVGEVVESLAHRYEGLPTEMADGVRAFVDKLLEENLIVARESHKDAARTDHHLEQDAQPQSGKAVFQTPRLEKYGDMQDLLLLDPIHDVDEVGWPKALPDTRPTG